ncbi:hypothetical protein ACODT5_19240 [Streptomyces sp. 5.8]|uniref:hypothetical protein n=1 Tax=Streptomyces sp. 5.8 TaxID=3406571 RepID=UPI003BB6351E
MFSRKAMRAAGVAVAALGLAVGTSVLTAGPAAAGAQVAGCPWPYVCFYKSSADWEAGRTVAMYKDMNYQQLGPNARSSYSVQNSRQDDVVWIKMSTGKNVCLEAKSGSAFFVMGGGYPVAIDISDSPSCG